MYNKRFIFCTTLLFTLFIGTTAFAQDDDKVRTITTAVPVLTLAPDARSAALGEAGVAISPDANTPHWNPAKLGFVPNDFSAAFSYSPWLRNVVNDMGLFYLSGYKRLGENSAFSASLLYFDLGEIQFRDAAGAEAGLFNPKEYTFDVAYGQRLSENLGLGIGARFIRSNLTGGASVGGADTRPASTAAVDVGIYYQRDFADIYNIAFGGNISNIGGKLTYTNPDEKDFIPTNLRLGTALTRELDAFNKITFIVDANKLLVPSPQVDSAGKVIRPLAGQQKGLFDGMISSFSDAPDGFSEEMKEINLSTGIEYWYNDIFAARAGYFFEHKHKGDRQFFSLGLGLKYQKFGLDVAYLIPRQQNNPLAQTLRFTLSFVFDQDEDAIPAE